MRRVPVDAGPARPDARRPPIPTNAEIARISCECFNDRDFERSLEYLDDEIAWTEVPNGRVFRGKHAIIEEYQSWARAFPDGRLEIRNIIEAGDWVVCEFVVTGTMTGPLHGVDGTEIPPTGKLTQVALCDVMHFRNGKVFEGRSYFVELPTGT